ncbi:MAG: ABC transporter permease subunit [Dehalococcoidia bacterium]
MNAVMTIARKELRDAVASGWLVVFAATFAVVAMILSHVQADSGGIGEQGFNRTTAGLINLCLLLVPLLALVLGAGAIAGERDRGTLATLLSQPVTPVQVLIGKYIGLTLAVWGAIAAGFGIAGLFMMLFSPLSDIGHYLLFVLLSGVLASAMLSLGILVSVFAGSRVKALGLAVVLWFVLVLAYDLGAIGFALAVSPSGRTLVAVALLNPAEATRLLAIMSIERDLDVLGPLGAYLTDRLGTGVSRSLLLTAILAWTAAPLAIAARGFSRQDV